MSTVSALGIAVLVIAAVVASMLFSFHTGARATTAAEIWTALDDGLRYAWSPEAREPQPFDEIAILLGTQRIPRTFLALIAGLSLGAAGALMQGFTRNPLAEPGILGVGQGAAAAVAVGVSLGWLSGEAAYTVPAIGGALIVTTLLFVLSSRGPAAGSPLAFILAGMALSALFSAVVSALVITNEAVLDALRSWATGSVAGRDFSVVFATAPIALVALVVAVALAPGINLLALGEDTAYSLGVSVWGYRVAGILAVAGLSAAAVAAAGPVAFIGLAAPHIVRGLTGTDYRLVIPLSALCGGLLALWADILGRLVVAPGELPMGVLLAVMGVPVFIYLVRRGRIEGGGL
ncbi:FecCD family ABC transporter permease [Corynebacterium yudongzhengii]|uniref:FecCD family ABC transporter permease n=1 Tax=Corynebacterium yudongzhengii TaxID=2080740 RepID=UPI001F3232C1|nr:iron ABC transporter permease [Corynebacterium yudongzhengii]